MSNVNPVGMPVMAPGGGASGGGAPWMARQYLARTFFTYESDTTAALNAGKSAQLTFNIAGDSDFFWTKFCCLAIVGTTGTTYSAQILPFVTALIVNTTTGRQYSSAPVPLPNVAGTGQLPFIVPMITLWEKKSTIQISLANSDNAVNFSSLQLSFHGIKAFY